MMASVAGLPLVRNSAPHFPLGGRGDRPLFFPCSGLDVKVLTGIPGVARQRGGVCCSWDAAPLVADHLGFDCPPAPTEANVDLKTELMAMPGRAWWRDLDFGVNLRSYQKIGALFLARRSYGLCCDPMRAGKTRTALAAAVLRGTSKTLIVCPALAKYVWAKEILKVIGDEAIILSGRSGEKARWFCGTCLGRGQTETEKHCPGCKAKNGQSRGTRIIKDVPAALADAKWVIVNYDLLTGQTAYDESGKTLEVKHLPGWTGKLSQLQFDVAIADEIHLIRGFSTDPRRKGKTRRERFCMATDGIPVVWGLTGTPIFGFTRDLWGQLDAISKGSISSNNGRLPFAFHARYCEGGQGEYGWQADGRSVLAESELPGRLEYFMIRRPRSLILKNMPAKVRDVYRIDPAKGAKISTPDEKKGRAGLIKLLASTLDAKLETIVDNVLTEIAGKAKVIVFCYTRDNARRTADAIEKAMMSNTYRTRMHDVHAKLWAVSGDTSQEARFQQGEAFREYKGAAVFVATIDSMQVAVSLMSTTTKYPTTSVHFSDLHWSPAALLQAEDRPYEPGTTGLTIAYYVVRYSMDEHVEDVVLPKVETLARLAQEEGAGEMRKAFGLDQEKETIDALYARLLKGAK